MKDEFMLTKILHAQTKNITFAAFILGAASLFSALLGLFRDRLLASGFGAGETLDVYYAAFRIPDFVAMVLIMGAISAAIVPIFSQYLTRSQKEAWKFLSNLLNLFLVFLIIVLIFLVIFTPQLIGLIAPGFSGEKKELAVLLTRIMFLSPILLGISNIITSVLQVFRRFLITALAPIMYNFGIIAGILFFVPRIGIQGLAWGVVLGGVLHLLIQVPLFLKVGFKPEKIFNWKEPGFREVIKLTIPRSIGLATIQINLIIVTAIASTLATGSIAIFSLAENLSRPLYTFFAVSFSTAAFPTLSLAFSKKAREKFNQVFLMTFRRILLFTLPAGIILFIFRGFFVKIILQAGKFGSFDASLTAACFGLFCLGIFAEGLTLLLAKAFYALHDTKTPTLLSIFDLFLTLILCLVFIKFFSEPNYFRQFFADFLGIRNSADIRVVALPLGISLSAIFQFLILSILFWRKKAVSLDGDSQ